MAGQIHEVVVEDIGENPQGARDFEQIQITSDMPSITGVKTSTVFVLEGLDLDQTKTFAQRLLSDPVSQTFKIDSSEDGVTVGYKPGVTNPATSALMEGASDLGLPLVAADVRVRRSFEGDLTPHERWKVASVFVNPQVQEITIGVPDTLIFEGVEPKTQRIPIRKASIEELRELSKDKLFLDDAEMAYIQNYFREIDRDPTEAELETLAGRWSEHCVHKTFKADVIVDGQKRDPFFKRLVNASRRNWKEGFVWSAFEDNAGVIAFEDGFGIAVKLETHNSPSALDPIGGAATGSGGVFRDILGTGRGVSEVNGSMYMFVVGKMDQDPSTLPSDTIHPRNLLQGLEKGVEYGNTVGIPTNNGSVHQHPDFAYKPTVLVGAWGVIKEERAGKGHPEVGDLVVVIGGRTGRDGIHGATFSSAAMTDRTTTENKAAVQLGDPILEKKIKDVVIAAGEAGLIRAVTDCGAAGLSSAVGEMGEDIGVTVDVSKLPVKYSGLAPWEKWMSESQERMALAIDPTKIDQFLAICKKFESEATVFGVFDGSNKLHVKNGEETIVDLDYEFIRKIPPRVMTASTERQIFEERDISLPVDFVRSFKQVLSHGNVASIEPIARRFDHIVQGDSAMTPFVGVHFDGPSDASVTTPLKRYGNEKAAVVFAHSVNPVLNRIDPYHGALWASSVAMARYVASGGDPDRAGLVDNFVSGQPKNPKTMGALSEITDALCDFMDATGAPFISGKDSLSSTREMTINGEKVVVDVPPLIQVSVIGGIPDVLKTVSTDIKRKGSSLYLVGQVDTSLGGSVYYDTQGQMGNEVPKADLNKIPAILRGVHQAIQTGEILSSHAVAEGGIATAVAQMAFGGDCGVEMDLNIDSRADYFLFSEPPGTIIVEIADTQTAERLLGNLPWMRLGTTTGEKQISVKNQGEELFAADLYELKEAWQKPMREVFS